MIVKLFTMSIIYLLARIIYRRYRTILREKRQITPYFIGFLYFEGYILIS